MKHNKSKTTFFHDIVLIFSPFYLSENTYVISLFSQFQMQWSFHEFLDHLRRNNNEVCLNRFSFHGHSSTFKFLVSNNFWRSFSAFYHWIFRNILSTINCKWKSKTRVTSLDIRVTSSNPRVTSSNPRVTSPNPRVRRLKAQVARLKKRVGRLKKRVRRLKARVRRLKARFKAIKPRVK